ncbi:MAG: thiamine diphosphokinase [Bacteroidales bacterium]|nr:thiamine diphosphokinase [Bacteroidales bacterium]
MEKRKHIVILAAGDFPTHPIPLQALHDADFVVCCDSAYKAIRNEELGMRNYVVVGDGDSLSEQDKAALGDRWIHVPEQDYNDLHKAMCWATAQFGIPNSEFRILAACGKREDHTLGNISYLATFAEEHPGIDLEMLTDYGRFTIQNSPFKIQNYKSFPRHQVSLFTLDPRTRVTATGLQWPLDDVTLSPWWQGTLNSALSDSFTLTSDAPLLVFQTYDPKPL